MASPAKASSPAKKATGSPALATVSSREFKVLVGTPASTKAEHVVRSRVLVCPNDLKALQISSGDPVWVEEAAKGESDAANPRKFICTISTLTSIKPGTCMLSQEAQDEADGWSKVVIKSLDPADPVVVASEVVVEGPALMEMEWKKPLASYILNRVDKCVVSSGTKFGVLIGGYLKVLRIRKVIVSNNESDTDVVTCGRINLRVSRLVPSTNNMSNIVEDNHKQEENTVPFAGLDKELDGVLHLMRQCFSAPRGSPSSSSPSIMFKPVRGCLLYGPPGTGKSLLARKAVERIPGCVLIEVEEEATAVETIHAAFSTSSSSPRVLLFDEIDVMCSSNREIVSALLTATDRDDSATFLLACTNHPDALEPALRRPGRLDEEIEIPPPSALQRSFILRAHLNKFPASVSDDDVNAIAMRLHGFVGADIMLLCTEAAYACVEQNGKEITTAHLQLALRHVQPSCLREVQVTVPQVRWDDIGGMHAVKQAVREAVELPLKHPDAFKRLGIRPPQGVLLYGPPGCSKTLLAKAVATESEMNFIAVKGPELLSKWVGDSEKAIKATFRRANQSKPCVVFLDEIDALASSRDSSSTGGGGVSHRVTSQLLQELDGIQPRSGVVVLCATNRPDLLDPALLRPGRIDRLVFVPPPDAEARMEILKISLRKIPHNFPHERLVEIDTEGFSGAEVASICKDAALKALEKDMNVEYITLEEVKEAAARIVPQITPQVLDFYNRFRHGQLQSAQ